MLQPVGREAVYEYSSVIPVEVSVSEYEAPRIKISFNAVRFAEAVTAPVYITIFSFTVVGAFMVSPAEGAVIMRFSVIKIESPAVPKLEAPLAFN